MGASLQAGSGGPSGARRRKGRRHRPMAEINVTPFVDVMLVLLIIFMVAAPLMATGVSVDLPNSEGSALQSDSDQLGVTVDSNGKIFIQETEVAFDELQPKLRAITETRKGLAQEIVIRGDKSTNYELVIQVIDRIRRGGYRNITFLTFDDKH